MIIALIRERAGQFLAAAVPVIRERAEHVAAAVLPAGVGVSLALINSLLGAVSLGLGISYQVWKWKREARRNESTPPFTKS
jgi:predicted RND superfamily exporter protein